MAEASTETGTTNTDAGKETSLTETSTPAVVGTENQDKGEVGKEKVTEQKTAGDKPTEKAAEQPVIPEKYTLKLPEGVLVDETMMSEFTSLGKEQKWTNETAQKMADLHLKAIGAFVQKQDGEHVAQLEGWSKEIQNDKDIGGPKVDETMKQARKVMALAKTVPGLNATRLVTDLNLSGLTTHPDIVRLFHYFGQFIGEDNQFIKGSPASNAPADAATIFYGPDGVKK